MDTIVINPSNPELTKRIIKYLKKLGIGFTVEETPAVVISLIQQRLGQKYSAIWDSLDEEEKQDLTLHEQMLMSVENCEHLDVLSEPEVVEFRLQLKSGTLEL